MEFFGGMLIGAVFLFSLLAFYPFHNFEPLISWWNGLTARVATAQPAAVGAVAPQEIMKEAKQTKSLTLSSPAFVNGGALSARFSCDGIGFSPALSISGVSEKAQSLVLLVEDPDAPKGLWVHWLVFNIPPTTREIQEGREPPGRAGENSWGKTGYGGPCPPSGTHRYFFRLYALSKALALPQGSTKTEVFTAMKEFILAETELMSRYERKGK